MRDIDLYNVPSVHQGVQVAYRTRLRTPSSVRGGLPPTISDIGGIILGSAPTAQQCSVPVARPDSAVRRATVDGRLSVSPLLEPARGAGFGARPGRMHLETSPDESIYYYALQSS